MPSERRLHPLSILFSLGSRLRSLPCPGSSCWSRAGTAGLVAGSSGHAAVPDPVCVVSAVRYFSFRYRYERERDGDPHGVPLPQRAARPLRAHPERRRASRTCSTGCWTWWRCGWRRAAGRSRKRR